MSDVDGLLILVILFCLAWSTGGSMNKSGVVTEIKVKDPMNPLVLIGGVIVLLIIEVTIGLEPLVGWIWTATSR